MSRARTGSVLGLAALLLASPLAAQGAIALQGYGYPPGQLTVRATSTGGALGEFDQAAPINPASLLNWGVAGAYFQYSPEFRSTTVAGTKTNATVARFPVFSLGLPLGQRYTFGISTSTLLERNYTTVLTARQQIRADSVTTTSTTDVRGGISTIQFAGAMQVAKWLRVGTALNVVTGENRVRTTRVITADTVARADTVSYGQIPEASTATFGGTALSFGVEVTPHKRLSIAGSGRVGFRMRADLNDSTRLNADVPNRAGAAVRWDIGGSNLAARYEWQGWSAMKGLGGTTAGVFDTKEYGVGAELPGPKIRGGQLLVRLGARQRDLPYGVSGKQATESLLGGGLGLPVGFGRAQLDIGVERAARKVPSLSSVTERGYILSFGFRLRT